MKPWIKTISLPFGFPTDSVSIIDAASAHLDAAEAGVPNGGAILVRPDGFIGFRAAPAHEATMAALDAHLATYLGAGSHQAV